MRKAKNENAEIPIAITEGNVERRNQENAIKAAQKKIAWRHGVLSGGRKCECEE
jgi:hypothetical protein